MNKIIFLFAIVLISCSEDTIVIPENAVSLINITEEPFGENCLNGGSKIETGVDANNNGTLESDEVQAVNYICNVGNSLINIIEEPVGDNCSNGGFKIETGVDNNSNGELNTDEIQTVNYICNINNEQTSLINIFEEPTGDNCINGGYRIETGIDTNANGELDTDEVQAVNYICNTKEQSINIQYNIEGVLTYGQSLAVGVGASNSDEDFRNTLSFIGGNSFTEDVDRSAFVEVQNNDNISYAPVMATILTALDLIETENNLDINELNYQYLPITGGLSGGNINSMNKGTTRYQNIINAITSAKILADEQNKTFAWRVINYVQGESNRFDTKQGYYDAVELLFNDFNTDIKAITGQKEDIIFILHQTSPWLGRDLGDTEPHPDINVQEAQLQLANDKPNVYLDGGSYQFLYADSFHPRDVATIGLKQGVVLKRILNDGEDWKTFQPVSHEISTDGTNYFVHLKFDVPTEPMRFDLSGDDWHNPRGKQTNFGFEVLNNGVEQQIEEPYITLGNTVVLTTASDPTGMTIRYAVNGHEGGGNLCDSQNIVINNKSINYVIDNFAVGFSEYVID